MTSEEDMGTNNCSGCCGGAVRLLWSGREDWRGGGSRDRAFHASPLEEESHHTESENFDVDLEEDQLEVEDMKWNKLVESDGHLAHIALEEQNGFWQSKLP